MQLRSTLIALSATVGSAYAAGPWNMTSWSGRSCLSGSTGLWAVGPNTNTCIKFTNVQSFKVTNFGPCTTTYYKNSNCTNPGFAVPVQGNCEGFDGQPIGSFFVSCTA